MQSASAERNPRRQLTLVTGAARSGKSEWAEELANHSQKSVIYVATAQIDPTDREWQTRIDRHRRRRPPEWIAIEVPRELPEFIQSASESSCLLVDSLGTWVANCLDRDEASWEKTTTELLVSLTTTVADVILVAEETGWGLVPTYPVGRLFRDRLGQIVRQIGTIAQPVYLVVGGHALDLSVLGSPLPRTKNQPPETVETLD